MTRLIDIGDTLIAARKARGLSQRGLAELLGVRQQQIARWEAERYACTALSRLSRVAEALGVAGWIVSEHVPGPADARAEVAAEPGATYAAHPSAGVTPAPVNDLGQVVARVREHGQELHERFTVTSVDVFGSFARGEQRPDSDIDLIVEIEQPTLENLFGAEEALTDLLGRKADTGSFDSLRPRIRRRVDTERVRVWRA